MKQTRGRKLLRAVFAATSLAVAGACFAQAAEQLWTKQAVDIREGKSGFSKVVVSAKKGEQLTVLAREGSWVKVQRGDQQGYIFQNMLSDKKVGSGESMGDVMAGGDSTSGMSTSAAGKGLDKIAEDYAATKHMDPKVVDAMIARNTSISDADRVAFMKQGNVGAERK
jgi:uncharacterized protein YgiM (DUF1202 family)